MPALRRKGVAAGWGGGARRRARGGRAPRRKEGAERPRAAHGAPASIPLRGVQAAIAVVNRRTASARSAEMAPTGRGHGRAHAVLRGGGGFGCAGHRLLRVHEREGRRAQRRWLCGGVRRKREHVEKGGGAQGVSGGGMRRWGRRGVSRSTAAGRGRGASGRRGEAKNYLHPA
jgi:hypothetical protein